MQAALKDFAVGLHILSKFRTGEEKFQLYKDTIYLWASNGTLTLATRRISAQDAVFVTMPCEKNLNITTAPATELFREMKKWKGDYVTISTTESKKSKEGTISIVCGKSKWSADQPVPIDKKPPEAKKFKASVSEILPGASISNLFSWFATIKANVERGGINGLIFSKDKWIFTDGTRLHMQSGMPVVVEKGLLMNSLFSALREAIDKLHPKDVALRASKEALQFVVKATGSDVVCHVSTGHLPSPVAIEGAFTEISPSAVGILVYRAHFYELLSKVIYAGTKEMTLAQFQFVGNEMRFWTHYNFDEDNARIGEPSGVMQVQRSLSTDHEINILFDCEYLLDAVSGLEGDWIQLVFPEAQDHDIHQVYLNSAAPPGRAALVMPTTSTDRNITYQREQAEKRQAQEKVHEKEEEAAAAG